MKFQAMSCGIAAVCAHVPTVNSTNDADRYNRYRSRLCQHQRPKNAAPNTSDRNGAKSAHPVAVNNSLSSPSTYPAPISALPQQSLSSHDELSSPIPLYVDSLFLSSIVSVRSSHSRHHNSFETLDSGSRGGRPFRPVRS